MEEVSIFETFGKNVSDEILEKVDNLSYEYSLEPSKVSNMLVAFLFSKSLDIEDITSAIINSFVKEKLIPLSKLPIMNPNISAKKTNKPKRLAEINFNQYGTENIENIEIQYEDSKVNCSKIDFDSNDVYSDMEIDENYDKVKETWTVSFHNDSNNYNRMFQPAVKILEILEKHGLDLLQKRIELYNADKTDESSKLHFSDFSTVDTVNQEATLCGLITVDHLHSSFIDEYNETVDENEILSKIPYKLTPDNIAINGFSNMKSAVVPLNLEQLTKYSFFSGQTVIIKGQNFSKTDFLVKEVLSNPVNTCVPIPLKKIPGDLRILIACGPFNSKNSDDNVLLENVLKKLRHEKCDVLILTGPFVDINNDAIQIRSETELYSTILSEKLLFVAQYCIRLDVHVVFVPSITDAGHVEGIFPQPMFNNFSDAKEFKHNLVHFVSNPSIFNIGPYTFGVSSVDILRHMSIQEINKGHSKSINRYFAHILEENNFYPLLPAHHEVSMDWTLWPKCHFGPNPPHCLILPSLLSTFAEDVNGIYCINPGLTGLKKTCSVINVSLAKMADKSTTIVPATTFKVVNI